MKPNSGQGSARTDVIQRMKSKTPKGKRTLPTMSFLKNVKAFQPGQSYPPWTGDESSTIKVSQKPIFEDQAAVQPMTAKYPQITRLTSFYPAEAKIDDPDIAISFKNPEVDPKFSSALFLCLSKGLQFFESGTFHIYPNEINPSGKYCVRMFENNSPVRLIFDDKIPSDTIENPNCLLLQHSDPHIMLPTLLHKAFLRFIHFEEYSALDVISSFTGFVRYEIPLEWQNLLFWFGRPDSLVALYIANERNPGLGKDRLFHILDVVEVDQHRKFVKLQCPGAQWRGRFSGFEEDTKHWTNQIRVLLEIDPETAATAGYFWMILDDLIENFDSIVIFSPSSTFQYTIKKQDVWVPKETQFYTPPSPSLLRAYGPGSIQICAAPLPTTASPNDLKVTLNKFCWNSSESSNSLSMECSRWLTTSLKISKPEEIFELETFSKGGYVLQMFSNDVKLDFIEYSELSSVTSSEGDLPFYISLEEFATNVFSQRFELIGKLSFNLDQPGNVAFSLYITNMIHKPCVAGFLFNSDTNDIITSKNLKTGSVALTPNKKGYILLVFGLYNESILSYQPIDLIGKWRIKLFSDVQLSDINDISHLNYTEVEGETSEMDESHQIQRHVLTGGCEAVIVLETSQPLSLTVIANEDEKQINVMRGVGFCVLPTCKIPGEKEPTRLIIRSICSEQVLGFAWKLRIFSTAPVNCKEDTAPAEKTAAAIAAWEKKRTAKPQGGKKAETKAKVVEPQVVLSPAVIDQTVISLVKGDSTVLTDTQLEEMLPPTVVEPPKESDNDNSFDPGDDLREAVITVSNKMNEDWDMYESKRNQITKLYNAPQPKPE